MNPEIVEYLRHHDIELPLYLQHILKFSGYDNFYLFPKITSNDIKSIEQFAREEMHQFITKDDNLENFYGFFKTTLESFKIVPGHQKLLLEAANKLQLHKKRKESQKLAEVKKRTKRLHSAEFTTDNSLNSIQENEESDRIIAISEHILKTQKSYLLGLISKLPNYDELSIKVNEIHVNVVQKDEQLSGMISCPFCNKQLKLCWMKQKVNYNARPIYGNYHNHVKTHIPNDRQKGTRKNTVTNEANQVITKFFKNCNDGDKTDHEIHGKRRNDRRI
ncbi:hypothetical protein RI129_001139 [Pyrocoelia pectoralis]|uniref:Uncharacterized protein n=1 Tax=Pyrocoelia pectoralis TaxID=417401 RepID=A0AAN7VJ67_9COLE